MGYKIISKKELTENLYEIVVHAPYITRRGEAGQFIILRTSEEGERVPLTIADINREKEELTIVFMAVGFTTKQLAEYNEGEEIHDLVGPLGTATETKKYGTVVCVAGGYGAAPCYLIAKALKAAGNKVYMIVGARNENLLFWKDKMKSAVDKVFYTTDDGSFGHKGFVTEVLGEIKDSEQVDYVFAAGPLPMMRAVANLTREDKIKTIASMNPIMVDGTGMCGACRVTVGDEIKFACVDGPDFDAHLVDFDEVINRSKIYKKAEQDFDAPKKTNHRCNLIKQGDEISE